MVGFKRNNSSSMVFPTLQEFPTELLLMIFHELDIPTLLNVCNVCKSFQQISTDVLSKKFKEQAIGLMLTFDQEHKTRFNIQLEFNKFNKQNGKFIFKAKSRHPIRFIQSPMVRSPVLNKVSVTGVNNHNEINEIHVPTISTVNNNSTTTTTTSSSTQTSPKSSSSSIKVRNFEENFLEKSLALNIKSRREIIEEVQYVYRVGHGTTHLKIPYTFRYSVVDIPPPSMERTRGGERWVTPLSFECLPSFFYPREPIVHKIIMNMINLRKKNLYKKKSSSSSSSSSSSNYEQRQQNIVEEVEETIPIELQQFNNLNHSNNRRLLERRINQHEHILLSSTKKLKGALANRWTNGARS